MRVIYLALSIFALSCTVFCPTTFASLSGDWKYVEKKLKKSGFSKNYINALKQTYVDKDLKTVTKLNVLLFLKTVDYHGVQVKESSAQEIQPFLEKHQTIFEKTEQDFGVPRNVIASLLWVETRHGKVQGQFHVPSVFLNLIQCERKEVLKYLQATATEFAPKVTARQRRDIVKRAKKKASWAIQELKALEYLYKKDRDKLSLLYGSFSGAFGIPQFIPSSYKAYARTPTQKAAPDLTIPDDAIYSVGHYLKKHSWKNEKKKTHVKTLMKYNNSRDYAEAILKLAAMLEPV